MSKLNICEWAIDKRGRQTWKCARPLLYSYFKIYSNKKRKQREENSLLFLTTLDREQNDR